MPVDNDQQTMGRFFDQKEPLAIGRWHEVRSASRRRPTWSTDDPTISWPRCRDTNDSMIHPVTDGLRNTPRDPESHTLVWKRIRNTDAERSWKRRLRAGAPIVVGLQPNDDYMALNAQRSTPRTNAGPYSRIAHAAVLRYRDVVSGFVVQDSRSTDFAEGQWFLPYSLATSPFVVLAIALSLTDSA